jgi:hypothetical protein
MGFTVLQLVITSLIFNYVNKSEICGQIYLGTGYFVCHCEVLVASMTDVCRRIRKTATIDCYLRHVWLSVRIEQLSSHLMDFHEIRYLKILRKTVVKIQV